MSQYCMQLEAAMRKTTRLKQLILGPELLVMPGCFDAMSARLIEQAGFAAAQASGLGVAASYVGLPDYSMLGMTDMAACTGRMAAAVDIPIMADGDTGFGNAVNVWYAVRAFERAGAAGINLEDQVMPKRCGHLDGKQVVSLEEGVAKIAAAAAARTDKDFVINARTDTLATHGIDEVIRRGNAYLAAGATMIFIDGLDSEANLLKAVRSIKGPVAINLVPGGRSPALPLSRLQEIGVARVSLPGVCLIAAIGAMRGALADVAVNDGVVARPGDREAFRATHALFGMDQVHALESQYLAPLAAKAAE
jgi:2-methylisocitrate lyase-like PEP mutase family enzyme